MRGGVARSPGVLAESEWNFFAIFANLTVRVAWKHRLLSSTSTAAVLPCTPPQLCRCFRLLFACPTHEPCCLAHHAPTTHAPIATAGSTIDCAPCSQSPPCSPPTSPLPLLSLCILLRSVVAPGSCSPALIVTLDAFPRLPCCTPIVLAPTVGLTVLLIPFPSFPAGIYSPTFSQSHPYESLLPILPLVLGPRQGLRVASLAPHASAPVGLLHLSLPLLPFSNTLPCWLLSCELHLPLSLPSRSQPNPGRLLRQSCSVVYECSMVYNN